jgi:carbonic anhydrase/acetyltransferase-like protein (isoleucine patch superfamily)
VLGSPGKVVRTLTDAEVRELEASAGHYVELGSQYLKQFEL